MKRVLVILASIAFITSISFARIINIPADYPTIRGGINASIDGDTLLVQPGIYFEIINFNLHNIVLGSLYLIDPDSSYIDSTIIDGDSLGSVITFAGNQDSTAILCGFTIRNGDGAGITCTNASFPKIINNIIIANHGRTCGGGIHCENASPHIEDNRIINNSSTYCGGGIYATGEPMIIDNEISGNWGEYKGGGIYVKGSPSSSIKGNYIYNNGAWDGGGIYCDSSAAVISNNIVDNNSAHYAYHYYGGNGGGIFIDLGSQVTIKNNLIIGNNGNIRGGGLMTISAVYILNNVFYGNQPGPGMGGAIYTKHINPIITNCILWRNRENQIQADSGANPIVTYCDVDSGWPGDGNIYFDPLFRNIVTGDYHLRSIECGDSLDSPCIDTGNPNVLDSLLDCSWGLASIVGDMGAFGGGDSLEVGIGDHQIDIPEQYSLSQNYPNPFNPTTTIKYSLPKAGHVRIDIFDILGRKVESLIDHQEQAGYHQVIWNAQDNSSGIYFYRIQSGDYIETKKMLLLK